MLGQSPGFPTRWLHEAALVAPCQVVAWVLPIGQYMLFRTSMPVGCVLSLLVSCGGCTTINPGQDDASGPRDGASRPDTGSFVPPDAGGDQSVLSDGLEDDTRSDPTPGLEVVLWTEYDGYIKTDGLNGSWDIPRTQAAMDDLGATTLSKVVKDDRGYDGLVQQS